MLFRTLKYEKSLNFQMNYPLPFNINFSNQVKKKVQLLALYCIFCFCGRAER